MKDTIRQLSRRLGVSTDTIRHYREIGMIHPDIQPNGYCLYDEDDLIRILSIREMRSMDISLPEAKDFVCQKSVTEYNDWLALREQSLRHQIYDLELRLSRLKETQVYASCGVRLMNGVEEFDGPATWALSAVGTNKQAMVGDLLQEWVDHFPFTYVSATIPLQSLNNTAHPLQIAIGVGSLIRYVEEFRLPCPEGAFFQPGGHFIRTCISPANRSVPYTTIATHIICALRDAAAAESCSSAKRKKVRSIRCWSGSPFDRSRNDKSSSPFPKRSPFSLYHL